MQNAGDMQAMQYLIQYHLNQLYFELNVQDSYYIFKISNQKNLK